MLDRKIMNLAGPARNSLAKRGENFGIKGFLSFSLFLFFLFGAQSLSGAEEGRAEECRPEHVANAREATEGMSMESMAMMSTATAAATPTEGESAQTLSQMAGGLQGALAAMATKRYMECESAINDCVDVCTHCQQEKDCQERNQQSNPAMGSLEDCTIYEEECEGYRMQCESFQSKCNQAALQALISALQAAMYFQRAKDLGGDDGPPDKDPDKDESKDPIAPPPSPSTSPPPGVGGMWDPDLDNGEKSPPLVPPDEPKPPPDDDPKKHNPKDPKTVEKGNKEKDKDRGPGSYSPFDFGGGSPDDSSLFGSGSAPGSPGGPSSAFAPEGRWKEPGEGTEGGEEEKASTSPSGAGSFAGGEFDNGGGNSWDNGGGRNRGSGGRTALKLKRKGSPFKLKKPGFGDKGKKQGGDNSIFAKMSRIIQNYCEGSRPCR